MNTQCSHCNSLMNPQDVFCAQCGEKVTYQKEQKEKSSLQLVIIFYLCYLAWAIISFVVYQNSDSLITEIAIEGIFIGLTLVFTFFDPRKIYALYNIKQLNFKNIAFSIVFPIISAVLVFYLMDGLNYYLFDEVDNVFDMYGSDTMSLAWVFVFFVVIPPIFEELAFRGFLFNQLRIIANPQVTILATAFIFALVHFSLLSFIWIFPFGMVLGYLRHRYNTLWLGMIVHGIHNFLVVMLDYYYFTQGSLSY